MRGPRRQGRSDVLFTYRIHDTSPISRETIGFYDPQSDGQLFTNHYLLSCSLNKRLICIFLTAPHLTRTRSTHAPRVGRRERAEMLLTTMRCKIFIFSRRNTGATRRSPRTCAARGHFEIGRSDFEFSNRESPRFGLNENIKNKDSSNQS